MYNNFQKIKSFVKKEKRLFLASIFLLVVFLLNILIFSSQKKVPEDCLTGECVIQETKKPQLSEKDQAFYRDDILENASSGYYRLTFQAKADQREVILVKLNTYTEKNETVSEILANASEKFQNYEIFFFLPEGFSNILFEKKNPDGKGNIFIKSIGIAKLNVNSQEEFAAMQKTIIGETEVGSVGTGQLQTFSDSFLLLQKPKTRLGQIFEAQDDYISGISFSMDIIQDKTIKDKDYELYLQQVQCRESDCQLAGEVIADKSFSIKDALEEYRQKDGTFLFPFFAKVEKGKKYFVSIDNSSVEVSRKNYLNLRGGREDNTYAGGSAGFRIKKNVYKIAGDLFFAVYGVNFDVRDGVRLLNGARIESLGKGLGKYTYIAKGEFVDIFDLWSASLGTNFDDGRGVIVGTAGPEAALIYQVNTLFPMQKVNFFAEQTKTSWKKVKVEYSFDGQEWTEASFLEKTNQDDLLDTNDSQEDSLDADGEISTEDAAEAVDEVEEEAGKKLAQVFDFDITPLHNEKTVYFKITPDLSDNAKLRYFSVKNLQITADLRIK